MICPACQTPNPENTAYCMRCGAALLSPDPQPYDPSGVQQQPGYQPPVYVPAYQQPAYPPPGYPQPQQYPYGQTQKNTGQVVWSILNLLFCCQIMGIIALVYSVQSKSAWTQEDFEKKMRTAKTLNLIATIGGAVVYVTIIVLTILGVIDRDTLLQERSYY